MGKKSKAPAVQSQSTTTEPWEAQQPFLRELFGQASAEFNRSRNDTFPEQTLAPVSSATTQAQQNILSSIIPMMQQSTGQVQQGLGFGLEGVLDVRNNPYLQQAVQAAIRPVQEQLTETVLPGIKSEAILSGNLGSSRQGIAEGIAGREALRTMGDISSGMYTDAYNRGLSTFEQALALAPGLISSFTMPELTRDAVGQQERQIAQDYVNEEVSRHLFEQNKVDQALANYAGLITGNFGGTSEGTATSPTGRSGGLLSGIGGAASGYALASKLVPGYGWVGAGLGALAGLFG